MSCTAVKTERAVRRFLHPAERFHRLHNGLNPSLRAFYSAVGMHKEDRFTLALLAV